MSRKNQLQAKKGSQKWLQRAVNECPDLLNNLIAQQLALNPSVIKWLSPMQSDCYAEYSDQDFLDLLGLKLDCCPLKQFWPNGGPRWDGLAKANDDRILLIEAKARIGEMRSGGSKASSSDSVKKIDCSLKQTQHFLCADEPVDWVKSRYYQYANRLAHLYLLAQLNGIDAYLVLFYFLNDVEIKGPKRRREWEQAVQEQDAALGLPDVHRLSSRVIHLYPDVPGIVGVD